MRQPALIRNWLFSQGFIVKNQNLREIARFSFIDLGLIPKLGWRRSAAFLQQLETYRKNTNDKSWSCLTHFYPRSYYLFYYYLLFWWADYCDALPEILQKPERSLIAELFFRTIVEIDKVIDEPGNGRLMLQNPVMIKREPEVSHWLEAFLGLLSKAESRPSIRRRICRAFWKYREECRIACQKTLRSGEGLTQVLSCKQTTVGGLFHTWSFILGSLYCPTESLPMVENAGVILGNACMAMQIHEDLLDLPVDFRGGISNIFHEILNLHPEELNLCKTYIETSRWEHLDGIWARQNLPVAYQTAHQFVDQYLQIALKNSISKQKTMALYQMLGSIDSHPIGI